ncbi:hypothetical protein J7438_15335 [Thalassotalea sp. G20_0]|uniref:hypothetical protein n=1 Tax=Thalassotalea sp. G20_0 TaxID=2821093 RepID=UPI001ADB6B6D|nr:hypothetical protein [Thalassotalea sp. G20_0]MBO9495451.1 hypothetical protein [Thalassotalea sp. G20_0]
MSTNKTPENYLQQPTLHFHNPLEDPRFEKRSIVIVYNPEHHLPVRMGLKKNNHAPKYIPANERFSIQSILGTDSSAVAAQTGSEASGESCSLTNKRKKLLCKNSAGVERQRKRYQNDPAFAEHQRERQRNYQRELRKDPAHVAKIRKSYRDRYKNNPDFAERERERQRNLRKDPAFVERRKQYRARQKERYLNDYEYAEHRRKAQRERYQNDPEYAEHQKKNQRERYQNDPEYAKRRRRIERERYRNNFEYAKQQRKIQGVAP